MKVTVLGCGSSGGVPLIGGNWGTCDPANPRNRRTRVSILVESGDTTLLVDTTPDVRGQLLGCGLQKLDAVLYTHAHADHCHGIDDLRSVNWMTKKPIDVYADAVTLEILSRKFDYIFEPKKSGTFYVPSIVPREIRGTFSVGDIDVVPFQQEHGYSSSTGYRFGDLAYSTDVHSFDAAALEALRGIKTWIIDCVRVEPHATHLHLAQTLAYIEQVRPERAYLTHMSHTLDYETLAATLPAGVAPAYDGLVIEC